MTTYRGSDLMQVKDPEYDDGIEFCADEVDSRGITMTLEKTDDLWEALYWRSTEGPVMVQGWEVTFHTVDGTSRTAVVDAEKGTLPNMCEILYPLEDYAEEYKNYPVESVFNERYAGRTVPADFYARCEQAYHVMALLEPDYYC